MMRQAWWATLIFWVHNDTLLRSLTLQGHGKRWELCRADADSTSSKRRASGRKRRLTQGFHQGVLAGLSVSPKDVSHARTRRPLTEKTASLLILASSMLWPAEGTTLSEWNGFQDLKDAGTSKSMPYGIELGSCLVSVDHPRSLK